MSLQACANLVSRADPERFAAAMSAPLEARKVLLPIYAATAEVARAPLLIYPNPTSCIVFNFL